MPSLFSASSILLVTSFRASPQVLTALEAWCQLPGRLLLFTDGEQRLLECLGKLWGVELPEFGIHLPRGPLFDPYLPHWARTAYFSSGMEFRYFRLKAKMSPGSEGLKGDHRPVDGPLV